MEIDEEDEEDDKIFDKLKIRKRKNSDLSDDANLSVCSAEFDRDMEEDSNDSEN